MMLKILINLDDPPDEKVGEMDENWFPCRNAHQQPVCLGMPLIFCFDPLFRIVSIEYIFDFQMEMTILPPAGQANNFFLFSLVSVLTEKCFA